MPVKIGNNKIKELYVGNQKIKEAYVGSVKVYSSIKQFTLTLANGVSANRTSSPSGYGTIGAITTGAAIFEGDTLTFTGAAKASTYTEWNPADSDYILPTPTPCSGDNTTPYVSVHCNNTKPAGIYRRTINSDGTVVPGTEWTAFGTKNPGEDFIDTSGVEWGKIYQYHIASSSFRTRTDYTPVLSQTSATVSGNVSVTLSYTESTAQEERWAGGGVVNCYMPQQNTYNIYIQTGDNVASTYFSTDPNASLGATSGKYAYGTVLYGFVKVLDSQYAACFKSIPSSWVFTTAAGGYRYYRIGSLTVTKADTFGKISLSINKYTFKFVKDGSIMACNITANGRTDSYTANAEIQVEHGLGVSWVSYYNNGYYIPATPSTITMTSDVTINPQAAAIQSTIKSRTGDRTSYIDIRSITTDTYIQKVTIQNTANTARTVYIGIATSSGGTPSTFIANGQTVSKQSTKDFTYYGVVTPTKYVTWKCDSGTWALTSCRATIYYAYNWTFR